MVVHSGTDCAGMETAGSVARSGRGSDRQLPTPPPANLVI